MVLQKKYIEVEAGPYPCWLYFMFIYSLFLVWSSSHITVSKHNRLLSELCRTPSHYTITEIPTIQSTINHNIAKYNTCSYIIVLRGSQVYSRIADATYLILREPDEPSEPFNAELSVDEKNSKTFHRQLYSTLNVQDSVLKYLLKLLYFSHRIWFDFFFNLSGPISMWKKTCIKWAVEYRGEYYSLDVNHYSSDFCWRYSEIGSILHAKTVTQTHTHKT